MPEFYQPSCLLQMLITCTAEHISVLFYIPFDSPWNSLSFDIWLASFRANPRKSTFSRGTVTFLGDVTGQIWPHFWHLRHRIAIEKLFGGHKNLIAKICKVSSKSQKIDFFEGTVTFLDDVIGQIWLHFWHLRHRIAIEKLFGRHKNLIAKIWSQCHNVTMVTAFVIELTSETWERAD